MAYINENIKLGIFDTLHDFWKERKLSKNDQEDEDDEPMDEDKQYKMRQNLVEFMRRIYLGTENQTGDTGKQINDFLKYLSNQNITSVTSNYERTVLKYYEEASPIRDSLHAKTRESLRYGDIIDSYITAKNNPLKNVLLQKYINSNGTNYILELSCGDHKEYSSFGKIQKSPTLMGYVANFVLNYYYPRITNSAYNAYFTFDAKTGVVAKTFRDINEVYQLVTPANIADSAVTTFKALNNRNEYFFPENEWIFNSNYYTNGNVQLKFLKSPKGFSVTNQFGFSLSVQTNNIITENFDFSSSQKQGPSVNYLVDLMIVGNKATPNVSSIINLSKLVNAKFQPFINNGLLFDIKRSGDYEQVNLASHSKTKGKATVLSTIDILCSLYARTIGQNSVWHNGEKMTLYRFPSVAIDPALLEFNSTKHKALDLLQELKIIKKMEQNGLHNDINIFLQKVIKFYNDGVYIDNLRKKGTAAMRSEFLVTILIKIRLIDIMLGLNELLNLITQIGIVINTDKMINSSNILQENINKLQQFTLIEDMKNVTQDDYTYVSNLITTYEQLPNLSDIINKINSFLDLTPNQIKLLGTGQIPLGLDYSFYTIDSTTIPRFSFGKFNYTGSCQELKFSNKSFANLFDVLNKFERMISSSSSRGSKNLYDKLHKMEYFTLTNNLYQSFFYKNIAEDVYNNIQPQNVTNMSQSPTSDEACNFWWENILSVLNGVLVKHQNSLMITIPTIILSKSPMIQLPILTGGSKKKHLSQKGGNPDSVQIFNLSDLLRLISGTAAQFIEGFISERLAQGEPIPPIDALIVALINNYDNCRETMNQILFLLANGLMTIQNEEDEGYNYVPTPTEFELLFCLSHYISPTGNIIDYYYLNANNQYYGNFMQVLQKTPDSSSSTGRGTGLSVTRINDINYVYNTSVIATQSNPSHIIPAEILNLLVLTMIDNTMQNISGNPNPKIGYFYNILTQNAIPSVGFDSILSWGKVMDYFYAYLYIFSRTSHNPMAFSASINAIKSISGGKTPKNTRNYKKKYNKSIKAIKLNTTRKTRRNK